MKTKFRLFVFFAVIACASIFTSCELGSADQSVKYTVSHYLQNIEDDEYTLFESEEFTEEQSNIQPKTYAGFTALPVEDSKISNGKNIIIKYNRNIITCTLNYNGGTVVLPDGTEQTYDVVSGKYGAKITKPVPLKKGYALEDWADSNGNTLGDTFLRSGTFTANYVEKSTSSYTVHHLYQNIENDYYKETITEKEILEGRAGTKTNAVAKNVKGFTAKNIEQKAILSDESTEVNVYYDRKLVTFSFNLVGGEGESLITKKYGTPVSSAIVKDPVKEASTFSGWSPDLPDSFTENQNFTAVWNVPYYTVKYLFENLDDSDYSADENFPPEKYYGTRGELTEVRGKLIPGFTAQNITQEIIKEDNSTVVLVKYKRNLITLYIDLRGGVGTSYIQGKYGQSHDVVLEKLNLLKQPVRAGFSLEENNIYDVPSSLDFSLENDEKTQIFVNWTGGTLVSYSVVILKERADYSNAEDRYESSAPHIFKGLAGNNTDLVEDPENSCVKVGGETFSYENFVPEGNRNIQIEGDESSVLYIYFNRKIINITYDLNGGNIGGKTDSVVISGRYDSAFKTEEIPQNLLREGCASYTWDSSYLKFPAEDNVVKANWTGKPYTVTFHLGDASEQKTYNYLEEYYVPGLESLTTLSLTEGGVSGWKLSADSETVTYACGAKFTLPSPAALDLYANVDTNYYTVRYLKQHIDDDDYDIADAETVKIFAAAGSTTNGVVKEFEGFQVLPFEQITVAGDSSTVLDIKYDRNLYTLHFNLDGGCADIQEYESDGKNRKKVYEIADVQCRYGSTFTTTDYRPLKLGYFCDILFWKNDKGETVSSFDSCSNWGFTIENICSDMNLTLSGEKINYKVSLHNTNGSEPTTEFEISVDTEDKALPKLSIDGYKFDGWYKDTIFKEKYTGNTFKEALFYIYESSIQWWQNETKHFYAKWTSPSTPSETDSIAQVGDIVLKDGKVIRNPKTGIEGFVLNLTDAQKANAIGIVSHKVGTSWRFIGKYNTPIYLSIGKVSKDINNGTDFIGSETDGFDAIETFKSVSDIYNYGTNNNITTANGYKSDYTSNWYIPAWQEMASIKDNYDHISSSLAVIGGAGLNTNCSYNTCMYQYKSSMLYYVMTYDLSTGTSGYNMAGSSRNTLPCHKF